jgi:hypothetical protein
VPPDCDSPDERPLDAGDLARFAEGFAAERRAHFRILGRLARLAPSQGRLLARVDRRLLDALPALRRYAGICVLCVQKPGGPR